MFMALALRGVRRLVVGGTLVALVAACSDDTPDDKGTAGNTSGAGAGAHAGSGGSGGGASGSASTSGSSGKAGATSGTSGSSGSGGGSAGSGGNAASGAELSASTLACKPDCPATQYCALLEVDCSGEPCLVKAVCKDRNKCSATTMCPHSPMETCAQDPEHECLPDDPNRMGICVCTENAMSCAPKTLDRRAGVCACVDKRGDTEYCSDVDCPDGAHCVIELGKGYCVVP